MIQDNIYTYLSGIAELTTLLDGDLIQWPDGEGTTKNGIIFRFVDDPKLYGSNRRWYLYRFFINNVSKVTCQEIAKVLEENLHDKGGDIGGANVQYIFQNTSIDPFLLADLETYQVIQDYRFSIYGSP